MSQTDKTPGSGPDKQVRRLAGKLGKSAGDATRRAMNSSAPRKIFAQLAARNARIRMPVQNEFIRSAEPAPFWALAALAGLFTAILFTAWPALDLYISDLFYMGGRTFYLKTTWLLGSFPRFLFQLMFAVVAGLVLAGLFHSIMARAPVWGAQFPVWLYLTLALSIGPGVIANLILKEHWGRARPFFIERYGLSWEFTPALVPGSRCQSNCSFVSGEASSIFMLFFALALVATQPWRNRLLALGLIGGLLAGLIRIGMGRHFASDVAFAGVFMALAASLLHWLVFAGGQRFLGHEGPLHLAFHRGLAPLARLLGIGPSDAGQGGGNAKKGAGATDEPDLKQ